ncbi:hypothetical protein SAMN04515695_0095 [Pseudovibrio sp. Tun.PSC04-5.I4]|nr:hypothetical protein SAMN04515695_0095 [Pseudovibrio sp. Tun.PSC04-5.I4]
MVSTLIKSISLGVLIAFASASPSAATKLDLAVKGGNFPAWSTKGECTAERSGQGCFQLHHNACGWKIYTTKAIGKQIAWAYNDGKQVDINTVSNGRFVDHICILKP